jgi:hypothetical protein
VLFCGFDPMPRTVGVATGFVVKSLAEATIRWHWTLSTENE